MANCGMVYLAPEPDVPQIIFDETVPYNTLITEFEISEVETHKVSESSRSQNLSNPSQVPNNSLQSVQYPLHLPGSFEEVPRSISPGDPFIQPLRNSSPVEDLNGVKIKAALQSQRTLKRTGKLKVMAALEFTSLFNDSGKN